MLYHVQERLKNPAHDTFTLSIANLLRNNLDQNRQPWGAGPELISGTSNRALEAPRLGILNTP